MVTTYAETKDIQRAQDLAMQISRQGLDRAIGAATKMAKLIKDTDKLLRRTDAVICKDLRLASPFIERCREFAKSDWRLQAIVQAYETGLTVGKYCPVMPKKYNSNPNLEAAFLAGFAASYGYNNFIGAQQYGI